MKVSRIGIAVFDRSGQDGWFCNVCTLSHAGCQPPMSTDAAVEHERDSVEHARNVSDVEMWNPRPDDAWVMPEDDTPLTFDELKLRTQQLHVDQVRDMVPFWMKGVEAAERGEVLRLEDFLEKLAGEDRWGVAGINDPWGPSVGPWPTDHPWGAPVPVIAQDDGWGKISNHGWPDTNNNQVPDEAWGKRVNTGWGNADAWGGGWNEDPKDQWGKAAGWAEEESTLSAQMGRGFARTGPPHKASRKTKKGQKAQRDPHVFVEEIARQQDVDAQRKRRMHDFYEVCTLI